MQTQIYYINSTNRNTGTDSNFSYTIQLPPQSNFNMVTCLAASIPKSFYQIETGYATFVLTEGMSSVSITLDSGNYNRRTFASIVGQKLSLLSPNGWTYSISYPNTSSQVDTGKYTYTVTGNSSQPSLTFNASSPYEALGFGVGTYTFVGDNITSPNVIKLYLQDNLFIHSDLVQNFNNNVLQEVYTGDNTAFSNIVFYNQDPYAYGKKIMTNNSNIYHFYLTDENDEAIELNGQNMVLTLMFYILNP